MATLKINGSVGENGNNNPNDVKTVQTLLNGYVASGQLGGLTSLPIDGAWQKTVPYIEKFQKDIVGTANPDKKIDPGKKTWQKLVEPPKNPLAGYATCLMAYVALVRTPLDTIKPDLWSAAINSLIKHSDHPKLNKPRIVTMVDFRLSRKEARLWTVDLIDFKLLHKTHCAHGTNSGKGEYATTFGDGDKKSSLGAYITKVKHSSWLGHVTSEEPALKLIGLEKGINGRAAERGILFHAATYVNPPIVGNSWGCFSTPVKTNRILIPIINDGTFVYAYAG